MKQIFIILGVAALASFVVSCTEHTHCGDGPEGPDLPAMTDRGWTHFEAHDYAAALATFDSALAIDGTHREARVGAGWCKIRLDDSDSALVHFSIVLGTHATDADALCGAVVAAVGMNNFDVAATHASAFLTAVGDTFVFVHDSTVNSRDVRILYALASFHRGDYPTALEQVRVLDPSVDLDPAAPGYIDELLAAIEALMG